MTELPTATVWIWSKVPAAAAGLTVVAWALARFEPSAWWSAVIVGVSLALPARLLAMSQERRGASSRSVLILGASAMTARLIEAMEFSKDRFRLIGAVDDSADGTPAPGVTPILGRLDQFALVVAATRPGRIVLAMSDRRGRAAPDRTLLESSVRGVLVEDGVDFFERVTGKLAIEAMRPSSLIRSGESDHFEFTRSRHFQALRGAGCRACALSALILASPLLALIAIAIKLDSAGPIFVVQNRIGRAGRPFGLVKFRTTRTAGRRTPEWPADTRSRITRVGRGLRRFRLDEMPQLVHVVRGEMNIVGPRPHPVSSYELLLRHIPHYAVRSLVRPGLTGWAQVRFGAANGLEEETEKMRYDFYYIKHRSLVLDFRIILETIGLILWDRRPHQTFTPRATPERVADLKAAS